MSALPSLTILDPICRDYGDPLLRFVVDFVSGCARTIDTGEAAYREFVSIDKQAQFTHETSRHFPLQVSS